MRTNLLNSIKWNTRQHSLEKHVSNHRQAHEDLQDCSTHITTVSIAGEPQRVEWLLDSINSQDPTLQAIIGLIRSDVNNMRNDFEKAASALIEVDPYVRGRHSNTNKSSAQISAIDFGSGRGDSGVLDLRWHTPAEFKALSHEQRDDLVSWQKTPSADPCSELDSHANMVVLSKRAFIFESSGRTCNVRPFSEELGIAKNVPIVDGAVAYDCPFSSKKSYIILFRNALSIPSTDSNLIPPFIM